MPGFKAEEHQGPKAQNAPCAGPWRGRTGKADKRQPGGFWVEACLPSSVYSTTGSFHGIP